MVNTIGAGSGFHADSAPARGTAGRSAFRSSPSPGRRRSIPRRFSTPTRATRPVRRSAERADRRRQQLHRRPPCDRDRHDELHPLRAVPRVAAGVELEGRLGRHLRSAIEALRPATWTSADAAGLPILPGLVTYDEVASGDINHAIRFTVPRTRREFVWPARHYASSLTGTQYPRMGERFRLKASFDITSYPGRRAGHPARDEEIRDHPGRQRLGLVHLRASRTRAGTTINLHTLGQLLGSNFEAVDATRADDRSEFGRGSPERRDRCGQPVVRRRPNWPIEDFHGDGDRRTQHGHVEREWDCWRTTRSSELLSVRAVSRTDRRPKSARRSPSAPSVRLRRPRRPARRSRLSHCRRYRR